MTLIRMHVARYPALRWLHHVLNGGRCDVITAKRLKDAGVVPGIADLFLPHRTRYNAGLYIEVKTATGTLSAAQKEFRQYCHAAGFLYVVARTPEEIMNAAIHHVSA